MRGGTGPGGRLQRLIVSRLFLVTFCCIQLIFSLVDVRLHERRAPLSRGSNRCRAP